MFTTLDDKRVADVDANWEWFCKDCGGDEDECECDYTDEEDQADI
jgi:hypothetical protein